MRFAYAVLPEALSALYCWHAVAAGVRLDVTPAGVPLLLLLAESVIKRSLLRLFHFMCLFLQLKPLCNIIIHSDKGRQILVGSSTAGYPFK